MTARRSFALHRKSVAASRQFVLGAILDQSDEVRETAILLVSELATNAIVHAATGFEVTVDRTADSLRIGVTDVGAGEPEIQSPPATDAHGRGLLIVQQLSDEWGMFDNKDQPGKTVWCTLRLHRDSSEGSDAGAAERADGHAHRPLLPRRLTRKPDRPDGVEKRGSAESLNADDSRCSAIPQVGERRCAVVQVSSFALAAANSSSVKRPCAFISASCCNFATGSSAAGAGAGGASAATC